MDAPAVKEIPAKAGSHTIVQAEVKQWAATSEKRWPDEACKELAESLTRMRWKDDPPDPPGSPWNPLPQDQEIDPLWDTQAEARPANALLASIPMMLLHYENTGNREAMQRLEDLRNALTAALIDIEFPYGYGQALVEIKPAIKGMAPQNAASYLMGRGLPVSTIRMLIENKPEQIDAKLLQTARRQAQLYRRRGDRQARAWHAPAVAIKVQVQSALAQFGRTAPKFFRDSPATRVVQAALEKTGYGHHDLRTIAKLFADQASKFK